MNRKPISERSPRSGDPAGKTIMEKMRAWKKKTGLALTVVMGLLLSACQTTEAGAVMALEEEGGEERHLAKKIFGGIVVGIRKSSGSGRVSLEIRRVPIGAGGRPLCRKPSGPILAVASVRRVFSTAGEGLRSALVVMGDSSRRPLRALAIGQCVSVAPDDSGRGRGAVSPILEIERTLPAGSVRKRIRDGLVEIWGIVSPRGPVPITANLFRRKGSPGGAHPSLRVAGRRDPVPAGLRTRGSADER